MQLLVCEYSYLKIIQQPMVVQLTVILQFVSIQCPKVIQQLEVSTTYRVDTQRALQYCYLKPALQNGQFCITKIVLFDIHGVIYPGVDLVFWREGAKQQQWISETVDLGAQHSRNYRLWFLKYQNPKFRAHLMEYYKTLIKCMYY